MASPKPKRRTKTPSGKLDEGLPMENKKQILGFFLALISLLVILSIISYSGIDQDKYSSSGLFDILKSESKTQNLNKTSNWVGIVGVKVSGFMVENTFGYFSVIIPGLLVFLSILLIRKKDFLHYTQFSLYALLTMAMLSTFAGLVKLSSDPETLTGRFSGAFGDYLSSILYHLIGPFPAFLIVACLVLAFAFLAVNLDFFIAFAKIKMFISDTIAKMRTPEVSVKIKKESKQKRSATVPVLDEDDEDDDQEEPEQLIKETNINRPLDDAMIAVPVVKKSFVIKPDIVDDNGIESEVSREKISKTPKQKLKGSIPNELEDETDSEEVYIEETLDNFKLPGIDLLDEPPKEELDVISDEELKENGKLLQAKLLHFGVKIEKVIATPGPVVTLYELVPAEDVKLSRIESLQDDIALAMKAKGIRMIIPIPGKGTVGIEIPNHKPSSVKIRSVIGSRKFVDSSFQLPIAVGKTISGEVYIDDLAKMPHLLIAGSTGSGKSVGINTIISSLLYKLHPSDLKLILIDPKKIELNQYAKLAHHYLAVSKDTNEKIITTPQNSVLILKSLEMEMERRYEKLANATVRNIADYNKKYSSGQLKDHEGLKHSKMPYLVCIIDELADLMITAAREVEEPIARLAQLARAVGIHLILATQRPSVDVITGVIKANFSARIAYLVNSKVDSRTILDMNGAEQLIGMGDMLYLPPGVPKPIRIQNPFISVDEVDKVTEFISTQKGFSRPYELPSMIEKKKRSYSSDEDRDELFEEAARLVIRHQKGSTSMLQRRMKIGYARAARIMDELEFAGIVAAGQGSKEREVLMESEAELEAVL